MNLGKIGYNALIMLLGQASAKLRETARPSRTTSPANFYNHGSKTFKKNKRKGL